MPQHAKNPEHRFYFYPVDPPEDVFEWSSWTEYQVCIPGPLIPYLLNVMKVYQWPGRVKTDDPAAAQSFVAAWNDLIARVGASVESAECGPMPYPIFRMNPDNACQTQQSLDGGETWTTILDTSACQPTIPPMIRFRQNPTQPYLLEQSHNNGSSWTTAFDYRKYKPGSSSSGDTTVYNIQQETINNYTEIWDNDPTVNNFAPNMVYDETPTPENDQRDKAICYAIGAWYDVMKEAAVSYTANKNDALAASGAGLVTAAVSTFGTPVAGFLAGAIVGALVKGISVLAATLEAGYYDEARTDIICCMYEALAGETLTQSRFQASVSACGFDPDSNSEGIRELVNALVQDQAVYLSFLKAASVGFDYASFAELPDCLCEDTGPCTTFEMNTAASGLEGIVVRGGIVAGQTISITATGEFVYYAPVAPAGPDGAGPGAAGAGFIEPTARVVALICRMTGETTWRDIGSSGSFVAPVDGDVYATVNETAAPTSFADNVGTLSLEICVEDAP